MTGTLLLTKAALRRDRAQLLLWMVALMVGAMICAINISTGYGEEAQRIASLEVARDNPALLIGRGLPMGPSEGAFLFYTYGVILATVFAAFSTFFAVRHGRAEEDDGSRELLRAAATGRLAHLAANFLSGTLATSALASAMILGLVIGGADLRGSVSAAVVCAAVSWCSSPSGCYADNWRLPPGLRRVRAQRHSRSSFSSEWRRTSRPRSIRSPSSDGPLSPAGSLRSASH